MQKIRRALSVRSREQISPNVRRDANRLIGLRLLAMPNYVE